MDVVQRLQRIARSRTARVIVQIDFVLFALVATFFTVRHFLREGWPLHDANVWLVLVAAALFIGAFAFKAWGWRLLFTGDERPSSLALVTAGGAAAVTGLALPGRMDEAVRISVVHRYPGKRTGVGTIGLSLVLLGLVDTAALTPLSAVAAGMSGARGLFLAGLIVVAVAGVVAAALVLALPRLSHANRLARFRLVRWTQGRCACPREATKAWALVSISWLLRGAALYVLLQALQLGSPASASLSLLFLCASAASAAVPIAPAGAATQVGAGAAALVVSGMHSAEAVAFALSAQALIVVAGAAIVVAVGLWHAGSRLVLAR